MKQKLHVNEFLLVLSVAGSMAQLGCAGAGSAAGSASTVAVSGVIGTSNSAASLRAGHAVRAQGQIQALDVSVYTAVCSTTTAPILTGTSSIDSSGNFNISMIGGKNQPMSCYLNDANGNKAADFLIEDTGSKDLNGNTTQVTSLTPTGDLNMSTVTFNPDTGEVTVPQSAIAGDIATSIASLTFDPSGAWTVSAVDFTLPPGVKGPCAASDQHNNSCNGPQDGQSLYLKLWSGIKTSDSSVVYGMQLWDSADSFAICGSKVGLSSAQQTQIGVDFSANGAANTVFSFPSSVTFHDQILNATSSPTLTDNWEMSTAETRYPYNPNCGPTDITIAGNLYSNAWKCGPDGGGNYDVNLSGGCTLDSSGASVNLQDWSLLTPTSSTDSSGIQTTTMKGHASVNGASVAVTCTNKNAVVNASNTILPSGSFNYSSMANPISAGTACSALPHSSNMEIMGQLRCYADYYQQSGLARDNSTCMPQVNMDWSATTAANFIHKDIRPSSLVFFEQFRPFPDGSGGAMTTRQEHFEGVQLAGGNSWVNCDVIETGTLSLKLVSTGKMLATYQSSMVTSSVDKPACTSTFTGSKETFIFYIAQ